MQKDIKSSLVNEWFDFSIYGLMIIVPNFLENLVRDKTFKLIYSNWNKNITFLRYSYPNLYRILHLSFPWSIFRLWLKQSLLPLIFIKFFVISIQNPTKCPISMVAIFVLCKKVKAQCTLGYEDKNFFLTFLKINL